MTASLGLIIPNTTLPGTGWPKRYADASIDEASIFCYDFSSPDSWPSQAGVTTSGSVTNLVSGGAAGAISGTSLPFSNGGLNFSVSGGQRIALPAASKLDASVTNFLFAQWITGGTQSQAVNEVGGYHYADTGPYGLRTTGVGTLRMICSGALASATLTSGEIAAFHIGFEQVNATNFLAHFFKNGVLLSTSSVTGPLQQPSTPVAEAALGDAVGTTYGGTYVGRINRSWLTTKYRTSAQIQEAVSKDYALNAGYFV